MFLHGRNERLIEYYFQIEIKIMHKEGAPVPVIARVSVHDTYPDGSLRTIMGRFQVDHGLRFGKIMRFTAFGPEKDLFEQNLNEKLFYPHRISSKELEVLQYLAKGYTYKEIAEALFITTSAVEKRIRPLFSRFDVRNNTNLVAFGYEHNLLP
jgi:DNA-binding CsgD family transcriptional regulator